MSTFWLMNQNLQGVQKCSHVYGRENSACTEPPISLELTYASHLNLLFKSLRTFFFLMYEGHFIYFCDVNI